MSRSIVECQDALNAFIAEYLTDSQPEIPKVSTSTAGNPTASDDEVIDKASSSKGGQKFKALMDGDWVGLGYPSASEARYGLLGQLTFWTTDEAQLDRIIRLSGLYDPKWERLGEGEIAKVLSTKSDHYGWPKKNLTLISNGQSVAEIIIPPKGEAKGIKPAQVARELKELDFYFATFQGNLHQYVGGTYIPAGQPLKKLLIKYLGSEWKTSQRNEIIAYLEDDAPELLEKPPSHLINTLSGIFNLTTGTLEPHTPELLSTVQINVVYDPSAKCDRIERFLYEIVPDDAVETLKQWVGYLLTTDNTRKKALLCLGSGSNGKSTLLRLIEHMLGPRNVSAIPLHKLEGNRFSTANLFGKLANIAPDLSNKRLPDTINFKAITGNDLIEAERKYRDAFQFRPFSRLIFSMNELFDSPDTTDAFLDRWLIVRFPNKFPVQDIDQELQTSEEISGFFNMAVEAWKKAEGRFTEGESMKDEAVKFHETIDPCMAYLAEQTVDGADLKASKPLLYANYKEWCQENGRHPFSSKKFNQRVHQIKGISPDAIKKVQGIYHWPGFALVPGG